MAETAGGVKLFFQIGNYFIMDSEQLVCNPFQEMQGEALTEAQKKASLTEKLTSVKNNVCDNHFSLQRAQLEREKDSALKQLHNRSSKLRYEVKLLDLDRQRHKIEVKKRVLPQRDYSYDEAQICNTEKRLGANIASFYLERRLKCPLRLRAASDISLTPTVQRARQALRDHDSTNMYSSPDRNPERVDTAKTVSSHSGTHQGKTAQRRSSRSAPLVTRSFSARADSHSSSRLPAIDDRHDTAAAAAAVERHNKTQQQVKFMEILTADDPMRMPRVVGMAGDEGGGGAFNNRPYTYHAGMDPSRDGLLARGDYSSQDLSDDDDDSFSLPDYVDLRALLFSKEDETQSCTRSMGPQGNQVPTPLLRRSQTFTPRATQDLIHQENHQVQNKVTRFLQQLQDHVPKRSRRHDDSDSDNEETIQPPAPVAAPQHQAQAEEGEEKLRVKHSQRVQSPPPPKDGWKYIKGRDALGAGRVSYRPEDLVLQTLTGVPLTRSLTGVPLHAASRALRHTATFKMRKVVDRMITDRTKYQQHEVEEIKRRMDQGMDMHAAAASLIPPPTPAPAPNPAPQSRKPSTHTDTTRSSLSSNTLDTRRPVSQGVLG